MLHSKGRQKENTKEVGINHATQAGHPRTKFRKLSANWTEVATAQWTKKLTVLCWLYRRVFQIPSQRPLGCNMYPCGIANCERGPKGGRQVGMHHSNSSSIVLFCAVYWRHISYSGHKFRLEQSRTESNTITSVGNDLQISSSLAVRPLHRYPKVKAHY